MESNDDFLGGSRARYFPGSKMICHFGSELEIFWKSIHERVRKKRHKMSVIAGIFSGGVATAPRGEIQQRFAISVMR